MYIVHIIRSTVYSSICVHYTLWFHDNILNFSWTFFYRELVLGEKKYTQQKIKLSSEAKKLGRKVSSTKLMDDLYLKKMIDENYAWFQRILFWTPTIRVVLLMFSLCYVWKSVIKLLMFTLNNLFMKYKLLWS